MMTKVDGYGPEKGTQFAEKLLTWYDENKRDLPWRRRAADPYAVWVSEIMLQQTTVAAVIPFYERWMARFPTVQSLADAPLDDVLKLWAGLGYYARARNLHKGAQTVIEKFGGLIPSDLPTILTLPGIGRYTAGAILSIAFGVDAPILDANVVRVLSRVWAVTGDPKTSSATQKELWGLAEDAIPTGNASDFNQAMMELGALVCVSAAPKCGACPVESLCAARASGDPTGWPQFSGVKKWLDVEEAAVAVRDGAGRVLLTQRSLAASLWGGLWEMPRATRQDGETWECCAARAAGEVVGLPVCVGAVFGTLKHVVANRKITLHGLTATVQGAAVAQTVGCAQFVWERLEELSRYARATPQVKLAALLAASDAQGRLEL